MINTLPELEITDVAAFSVGNTVAIQLTQNQVALIDAEDFERVNQYKWCASRDVRFKYRNVFRAQTKMLLPDGKVCVESLHRFLLNAPKGFVVDHIDGNPLNNRKENLRICTQSENTRNRRTSKNNTTGFKGVSARKDRPSKPFVAYITLKGKRFHLGYYATAVAAATAYDLAAVEMYGEFAFLNFPVK